MLAPSELSAAIDDAILNNVDGAAAKRPAQKALFQMLLQCVGELLACDWPGERVQQLAQSCTRALLEQGFVHENEALSGNVVRFSDSSDSGLRVTEFVLDPLSGRHYGLTVYLQVPLSVPETGLVRLGAVLTTGDASGDIPGASMEVVTARSPSLLAQEEYLRTYVEHVQSELVLLDDTTMERVGRRLANALTGTLSH